MKLVPILTSIVAGFAMLATVGSNSASALEFKLSGTFDSKGRTGLAGGSFNGTFSYLGGVVSADYYAPLSSFSINFLSATNTVVDTFNSNISGSRGAIYGSYNGSNSDILTFNNSNDQLQLAFPRVNEKRCGRVVSVLDTLT